MLSVLFIVNPVSGGKDKGNVLSAVEKRLDRSQFTHEVVFTKGPGHASSLARDSRADVVVAVGGDGTVSEVGRGLLGSDKAMGIIPCGSGNGLALHLGISRNPRKAVDVLNANSPMAVDVAYMNGNPFFCTAGLGLDAAVSLDFSHTTGRGLANYIRLAWDEWKHGGEDEYVIETGGERIWSGKAVFVVAANANQWGNNARIAPMASIRDGLLDLVVVPLFHTVEIPGLAVRLMTGKAATSHRYLHFAAPCFNVGRSRAGAVHYDGDPFEGGTAFDLSVKQAALKVLVPPLKTESL